MSAKLSNDDRCAVDLYLDQPEGHGSAMNSCFKTAPTAELAQRLTKVEQLLKTLEAHPVPDPAGDLLARTLSRCKVGDLPGVVGGVAEPAGFGQQA